MLEHWYRHALHREILFTDGAKYVANKAGPYWLLDIIAIAQRHENVVAAEEFQAWTLKINADPTGLVTCDDDNGRIVYRQDLEALLAFGAKNLHPPVYAGPTTAAARLPLRPVAARPPPQDAAKLGNLVSLSGPPI